MPEFDKQIDLEPSEYRREDQPGRYRLLDLVSSIIALAILYPIGWWLKENHFIANWLRSIFH